MKLYRIVPNTFNLNVVLNEEILGKLNFINFEELYYKLGFTSFIENEQLNKYTYVANCANSFNNCYRGKFFFLYPENAIRTALTVIQSKGINCASYILLEYDIPVEIVAEYIGYGKYDMGDFVSKYLECFIPINIFGTDLVNPINQDIKNNVFHEFLNATILDMKNLICDRKSDMEYKEYINTLLIKYYKILNEIDYKQKIEDSYLYKSFMQNTNSIIKNDFITGNMAFISENDVCDIIYDDESITELLRKKNFSNEKIRLKPNEYYEDKIVDQIFGNDKKDKMYVKCILNQL